MKFFLDTAWTDDYDDAGNPKLKWQRYPRSFSSLIAARRAMNRIEGRSQGEAVVRLVNEAGQECRSFDGSPL